MFCVARAGSAAEADAEAPPAPAEAAVPVEATIVPDELERELPIFPSAPRGPSPMPVRWKETASPPPPATGAPLAEKPELSPEDDFPPPPSHPLEPLEQAPKKAAAAIKNHARLMPR